MKNEENGQLNLPVGIGYIIGSVITLVCGVLGFLISADFVISLAASVPIGITTGIGLESKFKNQNLSVSKSGKRMLQILLLIGTLIFIGVVLIHSQK